VSATKPHRHEATMTEHEKTMTRNTQSPFFCKSSRMVNACYSAIADYGIFARFRWLCAG